MEMLQSHLPVALRGKREKISLYVCVYVICWDVCNFTMLKMLCLNVSDLFIETCYKRSAANTQSPGETYHVLIACQYFLVSYLAALASLSFKLHMLICCHLCLFVPRWELVSQRCLMVVHLKLTVPLHGFTQKLKVQGLFLCVITNVYCGTVVMLTFSFRMLRSP